MSGGLSGISGNRLNALSARSSVHPFKSSAESVVADDLFGATSHFSFRVSWPISESAYASAAKDAGTCTASAKRSIDVEDRDPA